MNRRESFRQRYKYWKETGELPYSNGLKRELSNQALPEDSPVKSGIPYPKYDGGKDGLFIKYVDSYRVNPDTGGVYDKVGEVKEGAVILPEVEVVGKPTGIEAMRREYDRISDIQRRQGLSGADPIGQFAVETAALNPVFKLAGRGALYGLSKWGTDITGLPALQNWALKKTLYGIDPLKWTDAQWDDVYFNAIRNGYTQKVKTLRDLHFKVKSPRNKAADEYGNPIEQYHTVADEYDPNFNVFNPEIEGVHSNIYTSDDPFMSGTYSRRLVSEAERNHIIETTRRMRLSDYLSIVNKDDFINKEIKIYSNPNTARKKILRDHPWVAGLIDPARQKRLYSYIKKPVILDNEGKDWAHLSISNLPEDVYRNIRVDLRGGINNWYSTRNLEDAIRGLDYDGAIIKNVSDYGGRKAYFSPLIMNSNGSVYQIKNPARLKYSDPMTYDDYGSIIPLSKRDNFNIKDLRYAMTPILFGSGIGSYYLNNK